ncbi:hypothetical protein Tco_1067242 [Tanacetum coccineum]|uniref:Reverse transcriptase domain-containing protein n=1 Tax=Tanacetum coccineum TaxID=301880 RepID=A0ABQ5HCX9_9ASTR
MHNQFSQILATFEKIQTQTPKPDALAFAIVTRSRVATRDPPYPTPSNMTTDDNTNRTTKEEGPKDKETTTVQNEETPQSPILYHPSKSSSVPFPSRKEQVEPLEWKASENRLKPSMTEPPKLELKELPEHLEYAFQQGDDQLSIVISFALSINEKTKLLGVILKKGGMTVVKNEKNKLIP